MTTEARGELVANIPDYPIQPGDIDTLGVRHFYDAFGHNETEASARWIVRLSQRLGGWVPFTNQQIEEFYNEGGFQEFSFNRLVEPQIEREYGPGAGIGGYPRRIGGGWIVEKEGQYFVTTEFVEKIQQSVQKT